jgi:hypothetical protein
MLDLVHMLTGITDALHHFTVATNALVSSSHDSVANAYDQFYDWIPAILKFSPITIIGTGVCAVATLFYLFTRIPEFLIVIATALVYTAVPLASKMF